MEVLYVLLSLLGCGLSISLIGVIGWFMARTLPADAHIKEAPKVKGHILDIIPEGTYLESLPSRIT